MSHIGFENKISSNATFIYLETVDIGLKPQ